MATIAFLGMFAAITPALISGAVADRMSSRPGRPSSHCGCSSCPSRSSNGCSGVGSVSARIARLRRWHASRSTSTPASPRWPPCSCSAERGADAEPPHSMPLVMIGGHLVVRVVRAQRRVGARRQRPGPRQAFMNTFVAASAAGLAWVAVEWYRDGHPTNLGAANSASSPA